MSIYLREATGDLERRQVAFSRRVAAAGNPSLSATVASLLPTVVFLVIDHWLGLVPAMIAASASTISVMLLRRSRQKSIGLLLPISLGYVLVKAIAGAITGSQVVYFGAGLGLSALIAIGVGATAFTKRPLAGYLLPLVTPYRHLSLEHPAYRRVAGQVTAVWALAELGITAWEAWHLTVATASEFVITRTVAAWPVMAVIIFFLIAYVRFRLDRHEHFLVRTNAA
jgi:hypothetical protein